MYLIDLIIKHQMDASHQIKDRTIVFTVGEAVRSTDAWNLLLSCSSKYEKELKELIIRFKTKSLLIKLH